MPAQRHSAVCRTVRRGAVASTGFHPNRSGRLKLMMSRVGHESEDSSYPYKQAEESQCATTPPLPLDRRHCFPVRLGVTCVECCDQRASADGRSRCSGGQMAVASLYLQRAGECLRRFATSPGPGVRLRTAPCRPVAARSRPGHHPVPGAWARTSRVTTAFGPKAISNTAWRPPWQQGAGSPMYNGDKLC